MRLSDLLLIGAVGYLLLSNKSTTATATQQAYVSAPAAPDQEPIHEGAPCASGKVWSDLRCQNPYPGCESNPPYWQCVAPYQGQGAFLGQ